MRRILSVIVVLALTSTCTFSQKVIRDPYVIHDWSVDGRSLLDWYTTWWPVGSPTLATIDSGSTVHVSVDTRFNSPQWSFTFVPVDTLGITHPETTMTFPFSMDTLLYNLAEFDLLGGQRGVSIIGVPVNYPPAPFIDSAAIFRRGLQACLNGQTDTTTGLMDSVKTVLALLRWGITAISYTDSTFWKFHEAEIRKLDSLNAIRYWEPGEIVRSLEFKKIKD